jgi:hypothetical protein
MPLTRENNRIEVITSAVVQQVMDFINGPDNMTVLIGDPTVMKMGGKIPLLSVS